MDRKVARRLASSLALVLLAPAAAPAQPFSYTIETIAIEGDPAPDGLGTLSQLAGFVALDDGGRVVFHASVNGPGPTGQILALHDGTSLTAAVRQGDPLPGTGGGVVWSPGHSRLRSGGVHVWEATYAQDGSLKGAFRRDPGGDSALALTGQPAPGGGTFRSVERIDAINAQDDVLFHAVVDLGAGSEEVALFLARTGGLIRVVRAGDPAPIGGSFSNPEQYARRAGLAADGSVVFWYQVAGGSAPEGLFRWTPGGAILPVILQGDTLQTPAGGTFLSIGEVVSTNDQGDVAFYGDLLRSGDFFARRGIYAISASGHQEVIRGGDVLPGTGGRHFTAIVGTTPPIIDTAGHVAFAAATQEGFENGVFVWRGGSLAKVAFEGEPVPGAPGISFVSSVHAVEMNDAGQIAFHASVTGGTGVFLATSAAPEVPLAPPWALGALGAALLVSGAVLARRR